MHRLCVAVELSDNRLLYITEGGYTHVFSGGDEPIYMSQNWELLGRESL